MHSLKTSLRALLPLLMLAAMLAATFFVNQQMKCPRIRIPKCPLIQNENVPWPPLAMF